MARGLAEWPPACAEPPHREAVDHYEACGMPSGQNFPHPPLRPSRERARPKARPPTSRYGRPASRTPADSRLATKPPS